jgi:prevent-host-death family protein
MNISSSELGERTGTYLAKCVKEPIVIERSGEPFAALLSYEDYEQFQLLKEIAEDRYWGELAEEARKEPSLSAEETEAFLKSILDSDD